VRRLGVPWRVKRKGRMTPWRTLTREVEGVGDAVASVPE